MGVFMKQYFTGFFTALCITSSVFFFLGAKSKKNDNLIVESITIINPTDNKKFFINGDSISLYDKIKTLKAY